MRERKIGATLRIQTLLQHMPLKWWLADMTYIETWGHWVHLHYIKTMPLKQITDLHNEYSLWYCGTCLVVVRRTIIMPSDVGIH